MMTWMLFCHLNKYKIDWPFEQQSKQGSIVTKRAYYFNCNSLFTRKYWFYTVPHFVNPIEHYLKPILSLIFLSSACSSLSMWGNRWLFVNACTKPKSIFQYILIPYRFLEQILFLWICLETFLTGDPARNSMVWLLASFSIRLPIAYVAAKC